MFYVFPDYVGDKLYKSWEKEQLTAGKKDKQPNILKAVARSFGWQIILQGFTLLILELGLRCSQPFLLGGLVDFYSQTGDSMRDMTEAYLYTAGLLLSIVMNVVFIHS